MTDDINLHFLNVQSYGIYRIGTNISREKKIRNKRKKKKERKEIRKKITNGTYRYDINFYNFLTIQ